MEREFVNEVRVRFDALINRLLDSPPSWHCETKESVLSETPQLDTIHEAKIQMGREIRGLKEARRPLHYDLRRARRTTPYPHP